MAKTLAKKNSRSVERTLKLRQVQEWTKIELESLEEKYNEKKVKKLNKKAEKLNKKLVRPAFKACDKSEYLDKEIEKDLQEFDIKNYLSYREANHGAAKKIFDDIKHGRKWEHNLKALSNDISGVKAKRQQYLSKLQKNKEKRIKTLPVGDPKSLELAYKSVNEKYKDYEAKLEDKYSKVIDKEEKKLERKLDSIDRELDKLSRKSNRAKSVIADDVILSVRGLKMYFGGLKAVDDLDFDVKRGEIFGLIGPNGAGKTTVFNCITQFYKPTAGELIFAPAKNELITLTDYKVHDIVLKGIARTFQNIEVVKEVSVLDNLLIAATRKYNSNLFEQMLHLPILKREEKYMRAKADKVLKYMDLYSYRDRLAWGLPYGVLKRIEIARALMCNPKLIILDEPAAGLNESETRDLAELINKIRRDFG